MKPGPLAWSITDRVGYAHAMLGGIVEERVAPLGLSRAQAVALAVLGEFPGGLSQAAWARLQGVSRQHAHTLARRLQAEGWIEGKRAGRERHLRLSTGGRRRMASFRPKMETRLEKALAGLAPGERRDLHRLLGLLVKTLEPDEQS
ncbi:MAG: MarR family transcriptional regulator [Deltaproteobacteria bacterium]|nr:MarR family transcriptional regulator [Deltaproteobacteria bacterium]MBW2393742.1 MarR family transcriptional regulator [Deltaproteobacteria bacterium]